MSDVRRRIMNNKHFFFIKLFVEFFVVSISTEI